MVHLKTQTFYDHFRTTVPQHRSYFPYSTKHISPCIYSYLTSLNIQLIKYCKSVLFLPQDHVLEAPFLRYQDFTLFLTAASTSIFEWSPIPALTVAQVAYHFSVILRYSGNQLGKAVHLIMHNISYKSLLFVMRISKTLHLVMHISCESLHFTPKITLSEI